MANTDHYPRTSPVRLVAQPPAETPAEPERITAQQRLQQLKKAYQRELRRKPTSVQAQLMDRAALLTVRAEAAVYDSKTSSNDVVRLDRAAQRAREEMRASFVPTKREPDAPTLGEVLRGAQ